MNTDGVYTADSEGKNRGLFVSKEFQAGDVVVRDSPLFCRQLHVNSLDVLTCTQCLRATGSLGHQFQHMSERCADVGETDDEEDDEEREIKEINDKLPLVNQKDTFLTKQVECEACGEVYCSPACLDEDSELHAICCGCEEEDLDEFMSHSLEHDETFLLGKLALQSLLSIWVPNRDKWRMEDVWECSRLFTLCHAPWETLDPPLNGGEEATQEHVKQREKIITTNLALLRKIITTPLTEECEHFLFASHEVYSAICGRIALNALCISFPSPQQQYWHLYKQTKANPTATTPDCTFFDTLVDKIRTTQQQREAHWATQEGKQSKELDAAKFPGVQGSGVFPVVSFINHSCDPNASYEFTSGYNDVVIVALRALQKDEELTICYCNETMPAVQRRWKLAHWGFICNCPRCEKETGQP
eukprot:TRINITY_DN68188_c10_g5_i1.p1 TRINITY_DN68188_c10_g5~~TRINITY_DN68188_c10_g5_i1.p1  ORF type:complete len:423 (+),score=28.02 TRINITY_DN68188_c10_g5_i1:23-1270(+)